MNHHLVLALNWNPQVRGGLYVFIAVTVLCGSCYLLLATNLGARLGFQVAAAGLTGFLTIIGTVWWVYGIGPKGTPPTWKPQSVLSGDIAKSSGGVLAGFPQSWTKLDAAAPEVADALPVAQNALTASSPGVPAPYKATSDFLPIAAYNKGGQTYGPFGLFNFRPLNLFHKPHYLIVEVQAVVVQEAVNGVTPKPVADPSATPTEVVMIRDLGSQRLNPAVFTVAAAMFFGLLVYQLHTRDKELMALQAAAKARS